MRLFIDDTEITSGVMKITPPKRHMGMIGNTVITFLDTDASLRTTYLAKTEKLVEFRHRTKTPFSNSKQFTVENGLATAFEDVITTITFTESDQYAYYDSLALRISDYDPLSKEIEFIKYNIVPDAWEVFSEGTKLTADAVLDAALTNWAFTTPANTSFTLFPNFVGYKKVVEIIDGHALNQAYMDATISETSGEVYFLVRAAQTDGTLLLQVRSAADIIQIGLAAGGSVTYNDNAGTHDSGYDYSANTWYFFKTVFDCATDKVSYYMWNNTNHEWDTLAADKDMPAAFGTPATTIRILTGTDTGTYFVAAVDFSGATGYVEDRILYLISCDIDFYADLAASTTNTYRLFYDDSASAIPSYFVGVYSDVTTSGTDPITVTTADGKHIVDMTTDQYPVTDLYDNDDNEWSTNASLGFWTFNAFGNTTRGYTWVNNIFTETVMYSASDEYFIIRIYNNGFIKLTFCNDVNHDLVIYHHGAGGDPVFVDKLSHYDGGWHETGVADSGDDSVDKGICLMTDDTDKDTSLICWWDESQTGATNIRNYCQMGANDTTYQVIGYTVAGGSALDGETTIWCGVLDTGDSAVANQRIFAKNLYDLYIDGDLTISALGSRTANTDVNYRLASYYINNLTLKDKSNELIIECLDSYGRLGRNKLRYNTNLIHKTAQVSSVAAQQIGIQCDYDDDKALDDVTYWGTGTDIADDYCNDYLILITHQDPTLADTYSFAESVSKRSNCFFVTGHESYTYTHQWPEYVATKAYYGGTTNTHIYTFTGDNGGAVTEIYIKYKVGISQDRNLPMSFSNFVLEIFDYDGANDWEVLATFPSSQGGIHEDEIIISTNPNNYIQNADGEMLIRVRATASSKSGQVLETYFLRISCLTTGVEFTPRTYTCSDSTKNTLNINAGGISFVTDGVTVGDGVAVVPSVDNVLKEMLHYAPELDSEDIPSLSEGMDIEVYGETALDVIHRIARHLDYQFWIALDNDFQFANSFTSSGYTFYTHGVNRNVLYFEIYDTREDMANRVLIAGKKIIIIEGDPLNPELYYDKKYQRVESSWQQDTTAITSEGLWQDIIIREEVRSHVEADDYATNALAKRKDVKTVAMIQILGDNYIETDILGQTVVLDVNGTQYTLLVEGITYIWNKGKSTPLILELRLGDQPANLDGNMLLYKNIAEMRRESRILASGRMVND